MKHADATAVHVKVELVTKAFRIIVFDDGKGFAGTISGMEGDGLQNMRDRMVEVGGKCEIKSEAGQGASITFELPFAAGGA